MDLRRRLDEEQAAYKRKLTAYQEGQQRQAQLVQKLQAKVRLFSSVFSWDVVTGVLHICNSFPAASGTSVQKEVRGSGADAAGEVLRAGETQAEREWCFLILTPGKIIHTFHNNSIKYSLLEPQ